MQRKNQEVDFEKMMKKITRDIINFASAEGARILIAEKEIRLSFDNQERSVRFMQEISDRYPNVKLKTCSSWKSVDVTGDELFDVAKAS